TDVKMTAYSQAVEDTQQISQAFMGLNLSDFQGGNIAGMLGSGARMQPSSGAIAASNYHRQTSSGGHLATNLALDGLAVGAGHMGESWSRVVLPALMEKNLEVYRSV